MILKIKHALINIICLCIFIFQYINFANAFSIIRDDEIESTISSLIAPLLKAALIPSNSLNIYIVDDPAVNAFVLGGQNIFIHTGLIEFSENPEALIGVIAHEIGHVIGGHLVAQKENIELLKKKMFLNMAAGFLVAKSSNSTDAGFGAFIAMSEADKRMFLKFNRQQESEADTAAIKYLARIGVPSDGLIELFKHLSYQDKIFHSDLDPYLSTHPISDERIHNIKAAPQLKKANFITPVLRMQYSRIVSKTKAWTTNETAKLISTFNKKDAVSNYARSICNFRLNNFRAAVTDLNLAIEQEPQNAYLYEQLAQYYYETGNLKDAIKQYEIAYRLSHKSITISMGYALALIKAKVNLTIAIKILEFVQSKEPYNVYAWKLLGLAYKLNMDEINSTLAFAQEAILKNDLSTAKKLISLASQTKSLGNKVTIRLNDIKLALETSISDE